MTTETTTTAPRLSVKPFDKYDSKKDLIAAMQKGERGYYFSKDTLRFFGARIHATKVCPRGLAFLFIESTYTSFSRTDRGFRVRMATTWGEVYDINEHGNPVRAGDAAYMDAKQARALFRRADLAGLDTSERTVALWSADQAAAQAERAMAAARADLDALAAL